MDYNVGGSVRFGHSAYLEKVWHRHLAGVVKCTRQAQAHRYALTLLAG